MSAGTASTGNAPVLDYKKLDHSTFGVRFGLVAATWLCLIVGTMFTQGATLPLALLGAIGLPVWGFLLGGRRVRKARDQAAKATGTQLLGDDHWLTQETARLSARMGLPTRPWVATMPVHNAYAIGANPAHALVVIGTPLLEIMTREEVSAIIGHELGHIANNDMRRMALAESFQKSLTWFLGWSSGLQRTARWGLSWCTELWVLWLSRKREYFADAIGAAVTSPEAMKSALEKVCNAEAPLSDYESRNARLMFRGKGWFFLSTHPTLEQRLAALDSGSHLRRLPFLKGTDHATAAAPAAPQGEMLPDAKDVAWAAPRAAASHQAHAAARRDPPPLSATADILSRDAAVTSSRDGVSVGERAPPRKPAPVMSPQTTPAPANTNKHTVRPPAPMPVRLAASAPQPANAPPPQNAQPAAPEPYLDPIVADVWSGLCRTDHGPVHFLGDVGDASATQSDTERRGRR